MRLGWVIFASLYCVLTLKALSLRRGPLEAPPARVSRSVVGTNSAIPPDAGDGAEALSRPGANLYARHCAGCHGATGEGDSLAGEMLRPPPRNLVEAEFKFSSRAVPGLPTDEDLARVIERGLRGTAMPGFALLRAEEVGALVAYLKTLSPRWEEPQEEPIAPSEDPWAENPPAGIALGERIYHLDATCMTCHPSYLSQEAIDRLAGAEGVLAPRLRPDAFLPVLQESPDGTYVLPPDFRRDRTKTGDAAEDFFRVISAGIGTTNMPSWAGTLPPEHLWGLAHYLASLAGARPLLLDAAIYRPRPALDRPALSPAEPPAEVFEE